jgi:hypothetical protein
LSRFLDVLSSNGFSQRPWDQKQFEELLVKWVIASDQPFEEVENPEFSELLNYVNRSGSTLKIPSRFTVKRCVMKMSADGVKELKDTFAVSTIFNVPISDLSC